MNDKKLAGHELHPETLAISYGYEPKLSEGAIKPPVFLTSTFQFESAEAGKRFFEVAYGLREREPNEAPGLIYSRINNPNLQILEERMAVWDKNEKAAVFTSGMAAISTSLLALLRPGDIVLSTAPIYGGTHYLFHKILPLFGIHVHQVGVTGNCVDELEKKATEVGREKIKMVYIETPANPSNFLIDIRAAADFAKKLSSETGSRIVTMIDNTFMGPVFQTPSELGADLTVYSATKFIGGHSDLVAGVVSGPQSLIDPIIGFRTILGSGTGPFDGWLLLRSLETLSVRMRRQAKTARKVAKYLAGHERVKTVLYPTLLPENSEQMKIYKSQCKGPGSLISFEVKGGQDEAYRVLNSFKICRLAVSLGGTETLVSHPMTMTHSDIPKAVLEKIGVTGGLIRMSVGLEHEEDLLLDLKQALENQS